MMTDIFSSFDPHINSLSLSPTFLFFIFMNMVMMMTSFMWIIPSYMMTMMNPIMQTMNSQSNRTLGKNLKMFNPMITTIFIFIIMMNFMGILPYVFSTSSHLMFTLTMGMPLWLALIMSSMKNNSSSFMSMLLPGGAPVWLNPFLIVIETISILVRPLTLSLRLAANMSAGHIILGLIGIYSSSALMNSFMNMSMLISFQVLYMTFEMGICLIQAYIFCLLITLYSDEHS